MKRISLQDIKERMYLDVLTQKVIAGVSVKSASKVALETSNEAGRTISRLRHQKARKKATKRQEETTSDPFMSLFGVERPEDVGVYEVYLLVGEDEVDEEPESCTETLAMAVSEANRLIVIGRGDEFLIKVGDVDLLRVSKEGTTLAENAHQDGVDALLRWEAFRPLVAMTEGLTIK